MIAVILVMAGILALFGRQFLWGIVLSIVGLLIGLGGPATADRFQWLNGLIRSTRDHGTTTDP